MHKTLVFSILSFLFLFSFSQENHILIGVEGLYYPRSKSFPASEKTPLRTKGLQVRIGYPYNDNGTVGILGNMFQNTLPQNADSISIKGKTFGIWQRNEAHLGDLFSTYYEFQLGYKDLSIKAKGGYVSVNGGMCAEIFPHVSLEVWASLLQYQLMWDAKKAVQKDFSLGGLLGGGISTKF